MALSYSLAIYSIFNTSPLFHLISSFHLNFLKKGEVPTNKIEKAIVKMLGGQNHHIEYWVRCNDAPIWHVDGDEVTQKNDPAYKRHYNEKDPTYEQEISHTSYVLYMKVELLYGGEFYVLLYF